MLSDKTILRDKKYNLCIRIILYLRKRFSTKKRRKINDEMKKLLSDVEFTIFSNNCLGGVFYHDAGKQFTSPLINTAMDGEDFIKFLQNPNYYINHKFEFIKWYGHDYPIAKIDDIEIRFVHYKSDSEAEYKFRERAKRIVWDNIFIVATNHDGLNNAECMAEFDKLPYKNKIMFVSKEYPQYDWAVMVPQFKDRFQVRIMTNFANFKGQRYYETAFDLVDWIRRNTTE